MPLQPGLFSKEIESARDEWRNALSEVAPKKPFGVDYKSMLKDMQKDPRITEQVIKFREFYHISEEGMEQNAARKAAVDDINKFASTFGGG